ncbi:MAG: hypothetical protein IT239_02975 [Bacteroidia bacterium]|nr:hypothetical protein [Bacteroidia bacterium]
MTGEKQKWVKTNYIESLQLLVPIIYYIYYHLGSEEFKAKYLKDVYANLPIEAIAFSVVLVIQIVIYLAFCLKQLNKYQNEINTQNEIKPIEILNLKWLKLIVLTLLTINLSMPVLFIVFSDQQIISFALPFITFFLYFLVFFKTIQHSAILNNPLFIKQCELIEHYKIKEQERLRLAKDIHDELGAGLSKLAIISEYSKQRINSNSEMKTYLENLSSTSKDLIENMHDLVNRFNYEEITLDVLVARLREYCSEFTEGFPVKMCYLLPNEIAPLPISIEVYRNVFSVLKEALNNAVKHSGATEIIFEVEITSETFKLSISDNGCGLDKIKINNNGNGLRNMRQRIESLGGTLVITGELGTNTIVLVLLPLKKLLA